MIRALGAWLLGLAAALPGNAATVLDDLGNPLDTEPPARRLIALSPAATEIAIAAGGKSRLVGANNRSVEVPPGVVPIDTLGGIDRERILLLAPDLVLAWASGNRPSDIAWLRSQGIPVFLSEPKDMMQLAESIRSVGALIGTPGVADRAANAFLTRLEQACPDASAQAVYVSIWDKPALSLGGRHWLNDLLERAGLINTFAHIDRNVFTVESEALLSREGLLQVAPDANSAPGRNRIAVDNLSRPGPSLAKGIEALCRQLATRRATERATVESPMPPG